MLQNALAHLQVNPQAPADLEIMAWDQNETGVPMPEAPGEWPEKDQPCRIVLPAGAEAYRFHSSPEREAIVIYHLASQKAVMWTQDARILPTYWHGSPLLSIFHWWCQSTGLHLLHGGCVGTEKGGIILGGKGGSGKSTTSLLCLMAGMRYVSDDYCVLESVVEPRAHSIYNTGKLHQKHLEQFPQLVSQAVDPTPDRYEKKVIFTHQHYPQQHISSLLIRAVVLPRIVGGESSKLVPISAAQALFGLAPSTMFQMPDSKANQMRAMGDLVRKVPCFRLELGTDYQSIPATIKTYLDTLN